MRRLDNLRSMEKLDGIVILMNRFPSCNCACHQILYNARTCSKQFHCTQLGDFGRETGIREKNTQYLQISEIEVLIIQDESLGEEGCKMNA